MSVGNAELYAELEAYAGDDAARTWLARALRDHRQHGTSLDLLLARDIAIPETKARRNELLRRAYALIEGSSDSARLAQLQNELHHLKRILPRLRGKLQEHELDELSRTLLEALRQGCEVPSTARQLRNIVCEKTGR